MLFLNKTKNKILKKNSIINKKSLDLHFKNKGVFSVASKVLIRNMADLSLVYTPGVGAVSSFLAEHKNKTGVYTMKGNSVAVISDGSAVLGLGNIGPEGALPVMEGKCLLFKKFANIDAVPIVLNTQDSEEIISVVRAIAPTFGGINLEDISAPRCFEIEERLRRELSIPVMHDDQHGTAIIILAGLSNALKVVKKKISDVKIVISGAGAAGTAIVKIIVQAGAKNILVVDRQGIIGRKRENLTSEKRKIALLTNLNNENGDIETAFLGADVFIGVSAPNLVTQGMIAKMNGKPIVFALANPIPEIMPDIALKAGAKVVATGRSDFPNQLNNALAFPGVFRGALDNGVRQITDEMKIRAAQAIAKLIPRPDRWHIVPKIFDKRLVKAVAGAIKLILIIFFFVLPVMTLAQTDGRSSPSETPIETPSSGSAGGTSDSVPTSAVSVPPQAVPARTGVPQSSVLPTQTPRPSPLPPSTGSTSSPQASFQPLPSISPVSSPVLSTSSGQTSTTIMAVLSVVVIGVLSYPASVFFRNRVKNKKREEGRCNSIKAMLDQKRKELEDFVRNWPEEKIKSITKEKIVSELKKDEDAKKVIETAESLKAKHDKLKETIEMLQKKYDLCMLELPNLKNSQYLSYLMGAEKIQDEELEKLSIKIEDKTSDGDRMLKITEEKLSQYIELVKNKLTDGFWNEVVGSKEIIFIFKFKDGIVKEYKLSPENEQDIDKLCAEFNNETPDKTANVYRYISDNKFYHDFMMEHYRNLINRNESPHN